MSIVVASGDVSRGTSYTLSHTFVVEKAALMHRVTSNHQPIFGYGTPIGRAR